MQARLQTPFGHILVDADGEGRCTAIHLRPVDAGTAVPPKFPRRVLEPLRDYFEGRVATPNVPTDAHGTAFQQAVWTSLARIPPGQPFSYGELAHAIGRPGAARAVGQALRINPLPIVWPCHRVIASNGKLGGFGGESNKSDPRGRAYLEMKEWLLGHELRMARRFPEAAPA